MDRVRDMAAGISDQASTTASKRSSFKVRPQEHAVHADSSCSVQGKDLNEKQLPNCATSQLSISLHGNEAGSSNKTADTGMQKSVEYCSAKDMSGDDITISIDTPLISIYPPDGNQQFDQLVTICSRIKKKALECKTDKQVRAALMNFLCKQWSEDRFEYHQVNENQKLPVKPWRAYFMMGKVVCSTGVASTKKAGKEKALTLFETLVREHKLIAIQESCRKEAGELGIVYEMVYMDDKPPRMCMASSIQDLNQQCSENSINPTLKDDVETGDRKSISAESILKSLPSQYANHALNLFINPAPKIPGFVLYESIEDQEKCGHHNPVSTVVNSCSMCKVPCEFISKRCEIGGGKEGIVSTVFICHENIATGLALATREAKHLAAHNAIKALKMTNPVLVKTSTGDGTSVDRNELTDSTSKEEMLPETNVGHKLLKMMGWKGEGAGLGKKEDGIANPVKATGSGSKSKRGLGCDMEKLRNAQTKHLDDHKVFQFLQDFARSDREDELVFSSELTKEERQKLHGTASKLGLKSRSRGKGESRYLIIGRKWTVGNLVQAVEEKGGSMGGYELHGPLLY